MIGMKICGHGKSIPSQLVTNDDLSRMMETSDEWIRKRTGIKSRFFTAEGESLVTMSREAANEAITEAGISPEQIGLVVAATATNRLSYPALACMIMEELGIPEGIPAFDVSAACTGFIYALDVCHALIGKCSAERPYALVVGAEENSRILDFTDRSTSILFGDGAGALVTRSSEDHRFFSFCAASGERAPLEASFDEKVKMDGRKVFNFAVDIIPKVIRKLEDYSGVRVSDVDHIVCHQANIRILENVGRKLGVSEEKLFHNIEKYGNLSAASIPVALREMQEQGLIQEGTKMFLAGFGSGLTWGGAYIEY